MQFQMGLWGVECPNLAVNFKWGEAVRDIDRTPTVVVHPRKKLLTLTQTAS